MTPVWSIFVGFQWFAPHFDEDCLTILNIFSKSESDICNLNGDDFSVRHWISVPNGAGWTYCISTFCQLFSQSYVWNNYFWKLSIFVNSLNYPSMFSCAVLRLRAISLECRVAIFILHPVWLGAWALGSVGDPPFSKIFKGPAYFLHRVGENICAILDMHTSSILSSGM